MKRIILRMMMIISLIGQLFGGDRYQFFLESDENLKLVGDNYDIIKSELDKMLSDYKSKIDLDNYWKEKYTERVNTGSSFNQDGYTSALLSMNNPSQSQANGLRSSFTRSTYKTITKERDRIIERGEILSTKEPNWSDIVSYVGGYSELTKLGISKDDKSKFDISVVLEKIELTGTSNCLAHVKINGNDEAFKFHKIPKSTYKYKGTYKIKYDDDDYLALYNGGSIWADFKFDEKKYLPKSKTKINIQLNKSLLPSTENYRRNIITMINDLVDESESVFIENSPNLESFRIEYKLAFGMEYQSDLFIYSLEEMKEKLNNFNKMKDEELREKRIQSDWVAKRKEKYRSDLQMCLCVSGIYGVAILLDKLNPNTH